MYRNLELVSATIMQYIIGILGSQQALTSDLHYLLDSSFQKLKKKILTVSTLCEYLKRKLRVESLGCLCFWDGSAECLVSFLLLL